MTEQQHPITPPPELVQQWYDAIDNSSTSWKQELATQAARWGADRQLNADCEWLHRRCLISGAEELRAAMRPKPPSLAEQALTALDQADEGLSESEWQQRSDTIRRALERLQELEEGSD
jgi:hypothetical protein